MNTTKTLAETLAEIAHNKYFSLNPGALSWNALPQNFRDMAITCEQAVLDHLASMEGIPSVEELAQIFVSDRGHTAEASMPAVIASLVPPLAAKIAVLEEKNRSLEAQAALDDGNIKNMQASPQVTQTPIDLISPPEQDKPQSISIWKQRYDEMIVTCTQTATERDNALAEIERLKELWEGSRSEKRALWDQVELLEAKLERLMPRSVTVKPSKEDGDRNEDVIVYYGNDGWQMMHWDSFWSDQDAICWLPGNLARICPDLLSKPQDKERDAFEAWWKGTIAGKETPSEFIWLAWQARAAKQKE